MDVENLDSDDSEFSADMDVASENESGDGRMGQPQTLEAALKEDHGQ